MKRIFDLAFGILTLVILTIPMLFIFIIIRLTSKGSGFHWSKRIGKNNIIFKMPKFRTMFVGSPDLATHLLADADSYISPIGRLLRATSFDEFPQLFSVLKGDMSFVGPRPLMSISFETYTKDVQKVIYNVKPGLTGIGSIVFRDEEQLMTEVKLKGEDTWAFYSNKIYPFKGELELWYQKNRSFFVDLKLIVLTTWVILSPSSQTIYVWFKDLPTRSF